MRVSPTFDTMSDEPMVKVRALMNVGQLRLNYDQVGEFPAEQVQPFLDRGRVELVDEPKPKRRSRRTSDNDEGDSDTGDAEDTGGDEGE